MMRSRKRAEWKRIFLRLLLFPGVLCAAAAVCAFSASAGTARLDDRAGILSDPQEAGLEEAAEELSADTGWDLYLVTAGDTGGRSSREYAEDYYMDHRTQDDGAVYLIDMDNREVYLATSGETVYYLTDRRIDSILDDAYGYLADEEYADAFDVMMKDTHTFYRSGVPDGQYTYNETTGEYQAYRQPRQVTWLEALFAMIAAAAAGFIFYGGVSARYHMKTGTYRYDFRQNSKLKLDVREDRLINRFITTRRIPKSPPPSEHSGSGSTTHTGSGGHTFGGGGRKF